MFVFKPGAGFSGECRKVEPGDDLKLSWSKDTERSSVSTNSDQVKSELLGAVSGDCHQDITVSPSVETCAKPSKR